MADLSLYIIQNAAAYGMALFGLKKDWGNNATYLITMSIHLTNSLARSDILKEEELKDYRGDNIPKSVLDSAYFQPLPHEESHQVLS